MLSTPLRYHTIQECKRFLAARSVLRGASLSTFEIFFLSALIIESFQIFFNAFPETNAVLFTSYQRQFHGQSLRQNFCWLSWQSAAPVSQRSWVQISYGPEFFSGLISSTSSVVFFAARISYIRFFSAVHIYEYHIYKFIIHHSDGLFGPNILTSSQLAC